MWKQVVLVLVMSLGTVRAQTAEDFQQGMDSVHRQMERRAWAKALAELETLLATHENQPHVWAHKLEIEEDLTRCSYYRDHHDPDLDDLISGKLISYNERSGKIKLEYGEDLRDFQRSSSGLRCHPAVFAGPYTITFKGAKYLGRVSSGPRGEPVTPETMVCIAEDTLVRVYFGQPVESDGATQRWVPGRIDLFAKDQWSTVDEKEMSPCRTGKPYLLKIQVSSRDVRVSYNGKSYLIGKKEKDVYGGFGFRHFDPESLVIEGTIETSWLAGLRDEVMQKDFARFLEGLDRTALLPAWLRAAEAPPAATATGSAGAAIPAPAPAPAGKATFRPAGLLGQGRSIYDAAVTALDEGRLDYVARLLTEKQGMILPDNAKLYLGASVLHLAGQFDAAAEGLRELRRSEPSFYWAAWRLALVAADAGRDEDLGAALKELETAFPAVADDLDQVVAALMGRGRLEDCKRLIARIRGIDPENREIRPYESMLFKAEKGPRWRQTFEYKSRHYQVCSDIDKEVCVDAAQTLEQAYLAYSAHLPALRADAKERFRVYLFSGEAGYTAYVADALGGSPRHTAGLYSPLLKQLLIWNLPSREEMLRTVQHEGFHQYLDQVVSDAPRWLDEGLAEYYECAGSGTWDKGVLRPDHLEQLETRGFRPLETFLRDGAHQFYGDGVWAYAQAWAFVHFLRHSSRGNARLFDDLLAALMTLRSGHAAIEKVFADTDLDALEKDFKNHVAALRAR
ncbi:MAG: DUF1570 domain-containing protein [Planctomycetes bacterium]|nr:DUF1570 domain-containing protein [Planctomycetota bacterium]